MTAVPRETPLEALHGGWPFGVGPDAWLWHVEWRSATGIQPEGPHIVCTMCGQSVTRVGQWSVTWVTLKPQVALHVMQVHSEVVTG